MSDASSRQHSGRRVDVLLIGTGVLFIFIAVGLLASLFLKPERTAVADVDILFIGNSYTYRHQLPTMFAQLAASGGHQVAVDFSAQAGWTLADHVKSSDTSTKIAGTTWDYVILQEQSVIPALSDFRQDTMFPAARQLDNKIQATGAKTILYMTWGRRDGLEDAGLDDFNHMQSGLRVGYMTLANEIDAIVAPVGIAWQNALTQEPELNLWGADGSHPSQRGAYLAACVFYAVVFQESPVGLSYQADLSTSQAEFLQTVAADTVLSDAARWHLESQ